jgi:hypothetical protein
MTHKSTFRRGYGINDTQIFASRRDLTKLSPLFQQADSFYGVDEFE